VLRNRQQKHTANPLAVSVKRQNTRLNDKGISAAQRQSGKRKPSPQK